MREEDFFKRIHLIVSLASCFLCSSSLGDVLTHLSKVEVRFNDLSISSTRFSAIKGNSVCVYKYGANPFRITEEGCIDGGDYEFRDSKWSHAGEHLAVLRQKRGSIEESIAVYSLNSETGEYDEVWSVVPNKVFSQVNSLSIIDWIDRSSLLLSTSCGGSCTAVFVLADNGYQSEPLALESDFSRKWHPQSVSMTGVDRSGKLFFVNVDTAQPAAPKLEYSDRFDGCIGSDHWYSADENRGWYWFEGAIDNDTIILSRHLCNLGVSFSFANAGSAIVNEDFNVTSEPMLGSPSALSSDKGRVASIKKTNAAYYLDIRSTADFEEGIEVELVNFDPDESSIEHSYDFFTPVWSPDDRFILVPKSPVTGGAIVVDVSNQSARTLEFTDSTGGLGFYWIANDKFISRNFGEMNVYEVDLEVSVSE
jgi:hypothetical protein